MSNSFTSLFGELAGNEKAAELLSQSSVGNIRIYKESRKMELELSFSALVSHKELSFAEEELKSRLALESVEIFPKMPPEIFSEGYFNCGEQRIF